MNDRQKPVIDLTSADAASRGFAPTPGPTFRTVDLEATGAYRTTDRAQPEGPVREIPGYELVREIGRGAFGVVYFGHAGERPEEPLAIKTIVADGNLDRLLVEPALLSRIRHPNVISLRNYLVHDGNLVLVMEYVPGGDLKSQLDRGVSFSHAQVHDFIAQIASALVEAHAQQIIHRDIKPSNVLVDSSASRVRYVLADFGIGRATEGVQAEKHIGGTFLYMAPEQLRGRPGQQSDLWAVGVIAYQSEVTGRALPGQLEETVLRLLRKPLSERTSTATELLVELGIRRDAPVTIDARPELSASAIPIAEKLRRTGRRATVVLVLALIIYVLINDVITGVLTLTGLWLFYHSQARVRHRGRAALLIAAAFLILSSRLLIAMIPAAVGEPPPNGSVASSGNLQFLVGIGDFLGLPSQALLFCLLGLVVVLSLLLPVVGSAAYVNLRKARREQALLRVALSDRTGCDGYLDLMRDMLATRFEDVEFHLRYAELLYARGDHRDAAVEARLITVQDPYHFNANLLLGNAYFALGLRQDCKRVCDDYLEVTGYCFEFQELREQCVRGVVTR
jgi:serine/threonine-protein kinase